MGDNRSASEKRPRELRTCYRYKLRDASELIHSIPSSEVEYGVCCNIVKESSGSLDALAAAVKSILSPTSTAAKKEYKALVTDSQSPAHISEYVCHNNIFKIVFEDRPGGNKVRKDMVYLQVSPPGKAFEPYEKEKHKLAITLSAYIELLKFFKSDFRLLDNRMESDYKRMNNLKECLPLKQNFSFRGKADIEYKQCLDQSNNFNLDLVITKSGDQGRKNISLQYTDKSMGRLTLPPTVMEEMGKDLPHLLNFLEEGFEYKEPPSLKRQRQC